MTGVFEIRVHGRGGQGVVTAAELLSVAAFEAGRRAQAFPSFGSERTGAPVVAFCRLADREIRTREPITRPHAVIVQDVTLLGALPVLDGLREEGVVVVNSTRPVETLALTLPRGVRALVVPATAIAMELTGRPVPNVALLGAFAAVSDVVPLASVCAAIRARFTGPVAQANVAAAERAFAAVRGHAHA